MWRCKERGEGWGGRVVPVAVAGREGRLEL